MIHLRPNEKILMIVHRHWFVLLGKIIAGTFLLLLPFILTPVMASFGNLSWDIAPSLFFFVLYLMVILLVFLTFWLDYYFDVWIITTERIVDIEQRGLFNREVSEFILKNVQDVTITIPGMIATFLKFGNIVIQTAGERSFTIKEVPDVYHIKNVIIDYSKNGSTITNHGGTQ